MHPLFIVIFAACAGWFFLRGITAKKHIATCVAYSVLGIIVLFGISILFEVTIGKTNFFYRWCASGPDMAPILFCIIGPAVVLTFLVGLCIKGERATQANGDVIVNDDETDEDVFEQTKCPACGHDVTESNDVCPSCKLRLG
ncbi:MAG: hypothetical protein JEZ07_16510 [Phycisphaerae bacterium]|nr:hypothetical protein [Phycisphaerae bacterium]